MQTVYLSANAPGTAQAAAQVLRSGGLVAIPTETVYGLGANGLDEAAVAKIFQAKGRPQDNPLILHVADPKDMELFCHDIPPCAYALAEAFWPGPLTLVLPAKDTVPLSTRGGLPTVALRCPDCEITRNIIRLAGVPVAAPSANLSGKPSTTTAEHVRHDHDGKIDMIVDGGPCRVGVESTIVDLSDGDPRLLRPGGITLEDMRPILGNIIVDNAVTASVDKDAVVKAPGMKYRHYAPACKVLIVEGDVIAAESYIRRHFQPGNRVLCFEEELPFFADFAPLSYGKKADTDTLLAGLFAALRQLDDPVIGTVFARCPEGSGKALAVQNRLGKAAGFCQVSARQQHKIIGITGGTGSGKTTLLRLMEELGANVMDCDAVYHRLLQQDRQLLSAIDGRFPGVVSGGVLDRKKLGKLVFSDKKALQELGAITHAAIKQEVLRQIRPEPELVVIDAIALFESGLSELCDATVAVTAPEEMRIARLIARDGISEEYARSRIAAQPSDSWFREKCDYALVNGGDEAAFRGKCLAFLRDSGIINP